MYQKNSLTGSQSGFFPAATFLLTLWYRRYEVQKRMAVFYTAASLSGAFSGLLAYGIEHMQGIDRLGGWQWYDLAYLARRVVDADLLQGSSYSRVSYL